MILLPQETTVLKGYNYAELTKSLQMTIAGKRGTPLEGSKGDIQAIIKMDESIPSFSYPFKILDTLGRSIYCIDLRKAGRREFTYDESTNTYKPILLSEANFLTNLALAEKVWINNMNDFGPIYNDACKVYAMLLAAKVAKRLVLGPEDQSELIVQFAYFFLTRTYKNPTLTDMEYNAYCTKITHIFGYQLPEVQTYLDAFNKVNFENINELCDAIKVNSDNPKLKGFNFLLLITILNGSWFGSSNNQQLLGIAVEYPPTFISMVYRGLQERSFKNTDLVQMSLRLLNSAKQKQFSLIYSNALRSALEQY